MENLTAQQEDFILEEAIEKRKINKGYCLCGEKLLTYAETELGKCQNCRVDEINKLGGGYIKVI